MEFRAEFATLYDDQLFAGLYPPQGYPVEVAPWRVALIMVMQSIKGLTGRQAAAAVRRCMDWTRALSLERTDPGHNLGAPRPHGPRPQRAHPSSQLISSGG